MEEKVWELGSESLSQPTSWDSCCQPMDTAVGWEGSSNCNLQEAPYPGLILDKWRLPGVAAQLAWEDAFCCCRMVKPTSMHSAQEF